MFIHKIFEALRSSTGFDVKQKEATVKFEPCRYLVLKIDHVRTGFYYAELFNLGGYHCDNENLKGIRNCILRILEEPVFRGIEDEPKTD